MTTRVLAYSIKGAAEAVSMSDDSIRRAIAAGDLRAKRVGKPDAAGNPTGAYRITAAALDKWIQGWSDA